MSVPLTLRQRRSPVSVVELEVLFVALRNEEAAIFEIDFIGFEPRDRLDDVGIGHGNDIEIRLFVCLRRESSIIVNESCNAARVHSFCDRCQHSL